MDPAVQRNTPKQEPSNSQLVRNILVLLASRHPKIRPDDVAHLADDLLNWDKLVEDDFVREWQDSIDRMLKDDFASACEAGRVRQKEFRGRLTLKHLFTEAHTSDIAFGDLQCAAIVIGNLIEAAIYREKPELARVIQIQVNAFWNAAATQALSEALAPPGDSTQVIVSVLPDLIPRAPELEE